MNKSRTFISLVIFVFAAVMQCYVYAETPQKGNNVYISVDNAYLLSDDDGNITYANGVTREMCTSNYWRKKIGNSADRILMTHNEIETLNSSMIKADGTNMYDLENLPEIYETHPVNREIPTGKYYVDGKLVDNEEYFGKIAKAIYETGYDGTMNTQYAIVTKRADMKDWPTDDIVGYSANDTDDELESHALNVNEPFVIRQKCVIDGKIYYNGYSVCCGGWVCGDNIAICDTKAEWLDAWKVSVSSKEHLVVTEDMIMLEPSMYVPEISEVRLMFGTILKTVPKDDIPEMIGERGTWNNYVVYLPTRDENGRYVRQYALISQHHKVNIGFLPLTQGNVIDVAFNCLGNRYGWGGMLGAMDCSMYTRQIYRCFGLEIPRNTTWQTKIPDHVTDVSAMSSDEKIEYIENIPVGSLLMFRGHITVYLGMDNGMPYVISDTGSLSDTDGELKVIGVMSVIVNPMSVRRANGTSWLENTINAVTFSEFAIDEENDPKIGDVDGNNKITATDAAYLFSKVHNNDLELPIEGKSDNYMLYTDVDGDLALTSNDVSAVLDMARNVDEKISE